MSGHPKSDLASDVVFDVMSSVTGFAVSEHPKALNRRRSVSDMASDVVSDMMSSVTGFAVSETLRP